LAFMARTLNDLSLTATSHQAAGTG
jgi:hypothetical protein